MSEQEVCIVCLAPSEQQCSCCGLVYCSSKCQLEDFHSGQHDLRIEARLAKNQPASDDKSLEVIVQVENAPIGAKIVPLDTSAKDPIKIMKNRKFTELTKVSNMLITYETIVRLFEVAGIKTENRSILAFPNFQTIENIDLRTPFGKYVQDLSDLNKLIISAEKGNADSLERVRLIAQDHLISSIVLSTQTLSETPPFSTLLRDEAVAKTESGLSLQFNKTGRIFPIHTVDIEEINTKTGSISDTITMPILKVFQLGKKGPMIIVIESFAWKRSFKLEAMKTSTQKSTNPVAQLPGVSTFPVTVADPIG